MAAEDLLNLTGLTYFKQKCDATYITEDDIPIETVKVNGTALTPDENKAVDVEVPIILETQRTSQGVDEVKVITANGGKGFAIATPNHSAVDADTIKMNIGKGGSGGYLITLPSEARVEAMIAAAQVGVIWDIVTDLPATGSPGKMYLKGPIGSGTNVYEEWIWINSGTSESPNWHWENIGTTAIDLSGYLQKTDIELITTAQIDALFT